MGIPPIVSPMQMTFEDGEKKVGKKNGGFYPKSFSPRVIVFFSVFYMGTPLYCVGWAS